MIIIMMMIIFVDFIIVVVVEIKGVKCSHTNGDDDDLDCSSRVDGWYWWWTLYDKIDDSGRIKFMMMIMVV